MRDINVDTFHLFTKVISCPSLVHSHVFGEKKEFPKNENEKFLAPQLDEWF